ncbi:MAG: hypothetical protein KDN05_07075 [Verrucomicrobiae bacterium]|nr:hypothetical protein [Verrucomicrobiae bacterium]
MKTTLQTPASRFPHSISVPSAIAVAGFSTLLTAAELRFLPVSQELAERKMALLDAKGTTELMDLSAVKRSKTYTVKEGETPLGLVALDRERPGGKPSGVELTIPEGMESPLVLVFPDADNAAGFRAVVVEDSVAGFPWGTLRFVNTTEKALTLRCDKDSKLVPASHSVVDLAPGGEARNIGVQLTPENGPEEVLYSAVWEHDPNLRKLVFILGDGNEATAELTLAIIPQDKRAKD